MGGPAQPYPAPSFPPPSFPADPSDPLISPDLSGWMQRSTAIIKLGWRPLLILQLLGLVISLPLLTAVSVQGAFNTRDLERTAEQAVLEPADFGSFAALLGLALGGGLVSYLLYALVLLASIRVVVALAAEGRADVRASLTGAVRRIFPLIGWQLLTGLLAMVAICACVLPVFYVMAATAVLAAVVTFERGGLIARCFRLFNGSLGTAIPRVLVIGAVWVAASMITSMPGVLFAPGADTSTGVLVAGAIAATVIQLVGQVAIGIVTAPMVVTAYADMRARIEPVSTSMLVAELDQR